MEQKSSTKHIDWVLDIARAVGASEKAVELCERLMIGSKINFLTPEVSDNDNIHGIGDPMAESLKQTDRHLVADLLTYIARLEAQ